MSRHTQDTATSCLAYVYVAVTLYGQTFQFGSTSQNTRMSQSYNPETAVTASVWAISVSLATTPEITVVFFSSAYLDVSVQRVCSPRGVTGLLPAGLPHSEIRGSIRVCQSPRLIAAYYVLHRLQEPRHPPYALIYFLTVTTHPFACARQPSLILNYVKEPSVKS